MPPPNSSNSSCCPYGPCAPTTLGVLAGVATIFSLASPWCIFGWIAIVLSVPVLILVLLPACMTFASLRSAKTVHWFVAALAGINTVLEIVSIFCWGTIADIGAIVFWFATAVTAIVIACGNHLQVRPEATALPMVTTATSATSFPSHYSTPVAAIPTDTEPFSPNYYNHPNMVRQTVTTTHNADGSITKITQSVTRLSDGREQVTETTEVEIPGK